MTDAESQQSTAYGYDVACHRTSVTDPLTHTTTYNYNAINQVTSVVNALNQSTSYSYTKLGQVASVTDPLGDQKLYGYNLAGDVTSVGQTGPSKPTNTTTYAYDKRHQLTAVTDALGHQTTYGYDLAGNRTNVTDALGHVTSYGYDAVNRVSSVTDALSHVTSYGYDAVGNRTSVTDPLGRATTYSYDGQGRVLTATDPLGGVTSYGYDLMGRPTSLTDPDRNTTSYGYDTTGRLTSMTDPLGHSTTYAYNALGQLTSTTDRDGRQRTFAYDANGRETSETWLNGLGQSIYTASYAYDAIGELTSASDPYSSYAYGYDSADRLTSVDNAGTPGVPHVVLSYGYDVYNNRTSLSDSLGGSVSYSYDAAHRLTGLALTVGSSTASVSMTYDNADRLTGLTRTAGAGSDTIASSFSYDTADRLTNITHTDLSKSSTLASYTYGYDNANQLTSYQDVNSLLSYGYDKDGQLTSASGTLNGSSYSASYSYDANGNRNMPGYSTGTGNELTSDGTYNYGYDNEGNMTSQTNIATSYVTYYTWDYRNRLTEVKQEDNHGTVLNDEKFTYDVFDNRIGVSLNGTQQLYTVYDGSNPYMDFNGSGTLTQRYLTNPEGLSQFYAQMSASGATQWFLTDNLDSIRQVVDTTGNLLDRITYDAYGQILSQTNSANAPRFGFAGGAVDSLTGNIQFDARPYGPWIGRFETEDPEGFAAGDTDLYRYVRNGPIAATDPTGLDGWTRVVGGLQFVGGTAEALVGVGLVLFPEPVLTKVGGVLVTLHGADNAVAGWKQMWTGEETHSYTVQALTAFNEKVGGQNHATAVRDAELVNAVASILFTSVGPGIVQQARLLRGARLINESAAPAEVASEESSTLNASARAARVARVGTNPNVQEIPIGDLKPIHPVPRVGMPEGHIENLARSISETGYDVTRPVSATRLPNGDLIVTGGHHRLAAMQSLGETTVPVRVYESSFDPVRTARAIEIGRITGLYRGNYYPSLTAEQQQTVNDYIRLWRAANGY